MTKIDKREFLCDLSLIAFVTAGGFFLLFVSGII